MAVYQFDTEHAKRYGVNEAIFLHNLIHWLRKNKAEGRNLHEGRVWTYSSTAALALLYDFWKPHQVRYVIDSLKKQQVILTGNFAEDKFDRRLWFALTDESLLEMPEVPERPGLDAAHGSEARFAKFRKSRREISQTGAPNLADRGAKSRTTYKEADNRRSDIQPEEQTLNVGRQTALDRSAYEAIQCLVELTGDTHSWRRFEQLWEICVESGWGSAWDEAVRSLRNRMARESLGPLETPGAYFNATLAKILNKRGVPIPVGCTEEREEVRGLIAASLAGGEKLRRDV